MSTQYNKDQELELIRHYQQTRDPQTLQKLRKVFAGAISTAIMQSSSYKLDQRGLNQKAMVGFQRAILNYDPTRGAAPTTAIINNVKLHLGNENNKYKNTTRLTQSDTILQTQIHKAKTKLEFEGNSEEEIEEKLLDEVQNLRTSKEMVHKAWIKKIKGSTRRELSGDRIIGESGVGEDLTYMNVVNVQDETAEDMLEKQYNSNRLDKALSVLTTQEQGLIRDKNPEIMNLDSDKKLSWNQIAINNNYKSRYLAEKAYEDSMEKLRLEMIKDE